MKPLPAPVCKVGQVADHDRDGKTVSGPSREAISAQPASSPSGCVGLGWWRRRGLMKVASCGVETGVVVGLTRGQ